MRKVYEDQIEDVVLQLEDIEGNQAEEIDLDIPYRTALGKATLFLKSPYKYWESVDVLEKQRMFFFIFDEKLPYSKKEGYRTDKIPTAIKLFEEFVVTNSLDVDMRCKTLNRLKDYLAHFWTYYSSSPKLQKALENA